MLQLPTKTTATTHYGGLRISPDRPVEYAAWGKAKQLAWDRACDKDGNLCNVCYDDAGNSIKVYFLLDSHGNPPSRTHSTLIPSPSAQNPILRIQPTGKNNYVL